MTSRLIYGTARYPSAFWLARYFLERARIARRLKRSRLALA